MSVILLIIAFIASTPSFCAQPDDKPEQLPEDQAIKQSVPTHRAMAVILGTDLEKLRSILLKKASTKKLVSPEEANSLVIRSILDLKKGQIQQCTLSPEATITRYWRDMGGQMLFANNATYSLSELQTLISQELHTTNPLATLYVLLLHSDYQQAQKKSTSLDYCKPVFQSVENLRLFLQNTYSIYSLPSDSTGQTYKDTDEHIWCNELISNTVDFLSVLNHTPPPEDTSLNIAIFLAPYAGVAPLVFLEGILANKFLIAIKGYNEEITHIEGIGLGKANLLRHYMMQYFNVNTMALAWNKTFCYADRAVSQKRTTFWHLIDTSLSTATTLGTQKGLVQFARSVLVIRVLFRDTLPVPFSNNVKSCLLEASPIPSSAPVWSLLKTVFSKIWKEAHTDNEKFASRARVFVESIPLDTLKKFRAYVSKDSELCQSWEIEDSGGCANNFKNLLTVMQKKWDLTPKSASFTLPVNSKIFPTDQAYMTALLHPERPIIILPKHVEQEKTAALQEGFHLISTLFNQHQKDKVLALKIIEEALTEDSTGAHAVQKSLELALIQHRLLRNDESWV